MALQGSLDAVEPFQVRGWVRDPQNPQDALTVQIILDNRTIGTIQANLYRPDLQKAGVGTGRHAFIYNLDQKLAPQEMQQVFVRVALAGDSFEDLHYRPKPEAAKPEMEAPEPLEFDGLTSDPDQYPVFILGAARSGTSAVAQSLLRLGQFKGYGEGHLLDVLAHLSVALTHFNSQKAGERNRNTTVALVSREYLEASLDEMTIRMIRAIFPEGRWIDKTPNANMIHLAPRFRTIWPKSRFIFMKRRFLENSASRVVKFPSYGLARNCQEWNGAMTAWLDVRTQLQGAAVEIDQKFLMQRPDQAAEAVGQLLGLAENETMHLAQLFRYDRPERTSDAPRAGLDITRMGWKDAEIKEFERQCSAAMEAYGYSTDPRYYLQGQESNGLVWV